MSENSYIIKYIKAVKLPVLLKVKNDKYFSCNGRSTEQYGCPSNLSSKSISLVNNFVNNFINRRYHVNIFREQSICPNLNSLQKQSGQVLDQNFWTKTRYESMMRKRTLISIPLQNVFYFLTSQPAGQPLIGMVQIMVQTNVQIVLNHQKTASYQRESKKRSSIPK